MTRHWLIWITFALFLALGLGAMGWMTRTVIQLESAQWRATAAANLEENVRLALWRMDYALAPIISQETARPYFEYSPVFPAERAYNRMYTELKNGDVLMPSPLLSAATSQHVLLHFQLHPDGTLSSPQAPSGAVKKVAEQRYSTPEQMRDAAQRLARLKPIVEAGAKAFSNLPAPRPIEAWTTNRLRVNATGTLVNNKAESSLNFNNSAALSSQQAQPPGQQGAPQQQVANAPQSLQEQQSLQLNLNPSLAQVSQYDVQQQAAEQVKRGQREYQARAQTFDNNDAMLLSGNNGYNWFTPGVSASVMRPLWLADDTLVLARRVTVNGSEYVQGCLLDWPAIRRWLLELVADRIAGGDLIPTPELADAANPARLVSEHAQVRMLAAIPVRLVIPHEQQLLSAQPTFLASLRQLSPMHVMLTVAWLGVILASAAVAVLLRGVIALAQRRAGFVAAVTHELRTPLTTLRMYTEMLADGMITDPQKQAAYHKTLRAEADRLGHLVENVLLYSRLERSQRDARVEQSPLGTLIDRLTPRLADRASQAGMVLRIEVPSELRESRIAANLLSVEQILFNLVDNACKHAQAAADRQIGLTVERLDGHVHVRVRDHGPGLSPAARARLFKPFSRSVEEAANSAPGLGLGLALSSRLAKNMGASLKLDGQVIDGAAFVLTIPLAPGTTAAHGSDDSAG